MSQQQQTATKRRKKWRKNWRIIKININIQQELELDKKMRHTPTKQWWCYNWASESFITYVFNHTHLCGKMWQVPEHEKNWHYTQ